MHLALPYDISLSNFDTAGEETLTIPMGTVSCQAGDCHLQTRQFLSPDECKQPFPSSPCSSVWCGVFLPRRLHGSHPHCLEQMGNSRCVKFTPSQTDGSRRASRAGQGGTGLARQTGKREQAGAPATSLLHRCSPLIIL